MRAAGSIGDALGAAVDALTAAGVESPRLDAELLLAAAAGTGRERLIAAPEAPLDAAAGRRFGEMVRRRLRREPVAYILGRKGFRHIEIAVDPRVLIPRPETERLVEVALDFAPRRVLDVGTGSGAVALAVAREIPDVEVVATDTSSAALQVATANADRLGLGERVRFSKGMLPEEGGFDLLLANLPYVSDLEWSNLQPEISRWEPRDALLAGRDGLDAIRSLTSKMGQRCEADDPVTAAVALEVGAGQAWRVGELLADAGYGSIETRRDLAGIDRVVIGRR